MRRLVAALLMSVGVFSISSPVAAADGVYSTELRRCVVFATSERDRLDFVRWIFTAMSAHPAVSDMSLVTAEMQTEANKKTAALMERLLLSDCRTETVNALKYEGDSAIEFAFGGVGETAMGDLMANPLVAAQLTQLSTFIDESKWVALQAETGRVAP